MGDARELQEDPIESGKRHDDLADKLLQDSNFAQAAASGKRWSEWKDDLRAVRRRTVERPLPRFLDLE